MWRWNFAFFELFPFAPTCNKKGTWTAFRIKLNVRSHTFAFRLKIFLKGASSTSAERRKIFIAPSLRPRRLCRANIFMWFFFVKQEREKNLAWMEDGNCAFPYTRNLQIGFSHFPHRNTHLTHSVDCLLSAPFFYPPSLLPHETKSIFSKKEARKSMQMKLWVICFNEWKQNFAEYCARTRLKAFLFVPPHTHRRQIKGCGKSRNHNFFFLYPPYHDYRKCLLWWVCVSQRQGWQLTFDVMMMCERGHNFDVFALTWTKTKSVLRCQLTPLKSAPINVPSKALVHTWRVWRRVKEETINGPLIDTKQATSPQFPLETQKGRISERAKVKEMS